VGTEPEIDLGSGELRPAYLAIGALIEAFR
jgi:hypothetical protein